MNVYISDDLLQFIRNFQNNDYQIIGHKKIPHGQPYGIFSFIRNFYSGLIASVGQTSTQAPSSVHFSASIT